MLSFRPARAYGAALLAALLGALLLPAGTAVAADRTVQGGRLDWGLKSSFQKYVTGPIANGNYRLTGGSATVGQSLFRFHSAQGAYDPDTGAFEARFTGGVHFTGHRKPDGSHELDLSLSRPTVRIAGGRGTLHADMVSKERGTGKVTDSRQVAFASLDLSGIDMRGGTSPVALSNVPATLTPQGATAFAGFYSAGTPLDPISLSVDVAAGAPQQPERTPETPKAEQPPQKQEKEKKPAPEERSGAVRDAAVDWGVRRTFREYVTGEISKGGWTLADGAQDGGALFRFPQGKGTFDAKKRNLTAAFAGSVRFKGEHIDLTLARVTADVRAGKGTLSADVTSAGRTEKAVPLVTFDAADLTPKAGLVALTEAPATLTERGSRAFGSMYKAGTAMDPVSLAVAVDEGARLPALPDLGSDAGASPSPAASATASGPASAESADALEKTASESDPAVATWVYVAVGAALLAAVAVATLLVVRRRRTTPN
ncbi:HtaA domain-containing protein [Streptomyces yaizuensis]|uniref:HtaA domain-containing protein n=1 Tax=Streptomyces yaizuensis TaxID=2989713 RepID=A0ABQ5NUD5_9ACTN|nr:HtaA domain-containing protein [Streptomyces sp. YSPA8]GLF93976.1 HtaA domain-containing protein [Streptomyces sp. YSPA8]